MLWGGYRGSLALIAVGLGERGLADRAPLPTATAARSNAWRAGVVLMAWPIVVLLLFVMIRSSFQHRPANLATFAFCDDAMVNSLVANSAYTVLSAVYGLKNESQSEMYGDMPAPEMIAARAQRHGRAARRLHFRRVPDAAQADRERASRAAAEPGHRARREPGRGLRATARRAADHATLSGLADQGIWFDQLYATGTRSVRGIEAVIAGFPPTPALSVVKLDKSQRDFATLASVLRRAGYRNEFVYGGESHFDNMRGFFLGNGFHAVVDRADFAAPEVRRQLGRFGRGSVRQGSRAHPGPARGRPAVLRAGVHLQQPFAVRVSGWAHRAARAAETDRAQRDQVRRSRARRVSASARAAARTGQTRW